MRADQIVPAMRGLAAALDELGVTASVDRRDLNLPGALVELDQIAWPVLNGDPDVTVAVELLASDTGAPVSLAQLTTMVAALDRLPGKSAATPTFAPNGAILGLRFTVNLERYAP